MENIAPKILDEVFMALDIEIEVRKGSPIELVICGGAALIALGLASRTTKDVDVLGSAEGTTEGVIVRRMYKFPVWLEESAEAVKTNFQLKGKWFNLGPASQLDTGMPEGFERRLIMKKYGSLLTLYFIGRLDQIHLKLYASLDRGGYHVDDLWALEPTEEELDLAASWVQTQDVSEPFRLMLKDFLERFGHGNIAERI